MHAHQHTSGEHHARRAKMWKIFMGAVSGVAVLTVVGASCLDRDGEAQLDRPGVTHTTAADLPPGGAGTSTLDIADGLAPKSMTRSPIRFERGEDMSMSMSTPPLPGTPPVAGHASHELEAPLHWQRDQLDLAGAERPIPALPRGPVHPPRKAP